MLSLEEAILLVDSHHKKIRSEKIPLSKACGRILYQKILSPLDDPPFNKATMDGWAVLAEEKSRELTVIETIAAGDIPVRSLEPGTCISIMTGAMVPSNTGNIIRVEYTRKEGNKVFIENEEPFANWIQKRKNLKKGDTLLTVKKLKPVDIGILASFGFNEVDVKATPRIGIISTGSELKEPGESLAEGQIFNSNGHQLKAHIDGCGCHVNYYGIVSDKIKNLEKAIAKALNENDILLLTGGVSMGKYDFVPSILETLGVENIFHKVAVKPGKPIWFGSRPDCTVFGLPGNPVSTFVLFEIFVKRLINGYTGLELEPLQIKGEMKETIRRETFERSEFLPVRLFEDGIYPLPYNGSTHLSVLSEADGLIKIDRGIQTLNKGEIIYARLI
jgi:molybdopterin molybdotransferase